MRRALDQLNQVLAEVNENAKSLLQLAPRAPHNAFQSIPCKMNARFILPGTLDAPPNA